MDHNEIKSKLLAFQEGEISSKEAREALTHLTECAECRADTELWKAFKENSTHLLTTPVPQGFADGIMAQILENEAAVPKTSFWDMFKIPRWEIATALSLSLFIAVYFSANRVQQDNDPELDPFTITYHKPGFEKIMLAKAEPQSSEVLEMALNSNGMEEEEYEQQ